MGVFGTLNLRFGKKKWIFPNLIFQLHPIITQLILNQFACSLPKTNTTFHQLFKYVKKEEIFSSIRGENSRNIFGPCSMRGTVLPCMYPDTNNLFVRIVEEYDFVAAFRKLNLSRNEAMINLHNLFLQ